MNQGYAVLGIDIGGTHIKAGVVDLQGHISDEVSVAVGEEIRTETGLIRTLKELYNACGTTQKLSAVGIGVAGVIDAQAGIVTQSPNFPLWDNFALAQKFSESGVDVPIFIENDANSVALGEVLFGSAKGIRNLIFLTLGTGVGGALILNGELWRGESGMAGEIGHMVIFPHGHPCGCGSFGCLEQYASQVGLRRAAMERELEIDDASRWINDPNLPKFVADLAVSGNEAALECFESMGYALGLALGSLLNVLNVKHIGLGGGVAAAFPLFEVPMRHTMESHSFRAVHSNVKIFTGSLGNSAGILGAAAPAFARIKNNGSL